VREGGGSGVRGVKERRPGPSEEGEEGVEKKENTKGGGGKEWNEKRTKLPTYSEVPCNRLARKK